MAAEFATDPVDNPLWWFAQEFYQREGVEAALIDLQDNWGADVLLILAACWLGQEGFEWPGGDSEFQRGLDNYMGWRDHVIHPLRQIRYTLPKTDSDHDFRARIKQLELDGEQLGLAGLFELLITIEAERWEPDTRLLEENLDQALQECLAESQQEGALNSDAVDHLISTLSDGFFEATLPGTVPGGAIVTL